MRLRLSWIDQAPRVLLVHGDATTLERWRDGFRDCAVTTISDIAQLDATYRPDVVAGPWTKDLAEKLRTRWPALPFIHFGVGLTPSVLEAIAQGQEILHVDRLEDLEAKVFAVTKPRRLTARRRVNDLTVRWRDAGTWFEVVDLSSGGLSFLVTPGADLARLQPGTELHDVQVRRGEQQGLSDVSARVRRIDVRDHGYLIGCELYRVAAPVDTQPRVIRDFALCAGLLHNAARSGVLFLSDPDSGDLLQPIDGTLGPDGKQLSLQIPQHPYKVFDIVDGHFELSGGSYRFRAAVCNEAPLELRVPAFLEETRKRATPRWRPRRKPVDVTLSSPLWSEPIARNLYDLSVNGLSFDVASRDVFPLGMRFDRIELKIGSDTLTVQGSVRSMARGTEPARCGVQLEGLDEAERTRLTDFIVRARYPGVENGRTTSFDELRQFFRDAGFLYPEKEAILEHLDPQVRAAYAAISARPNAISRSVAIRQDGKLVGYCAGLQAYHSTWMFHHLAALPGNASGALLSMGTVEHLMQSVEYDYFRIWFFAEASFPRRIFGSFARMVAHADQSLLRYYAHFHVPIDRRFGGAETGLDTSEATDDELHVIERFFVVHERLIAIRAEDLTARGLRLDSVAVAYAREGVERRRHVLVARRDSVVVGFALAELSSPGLNLSEALSSFRMFVLPAAAAIKSDVHRALLDATLAFYAGHGRIVGRCLIDPSEQVDIESLGIELDQGRSACWTGHRVQLPPFTAHMRNLFARLATRRRDVKLPGA